MAGTEFQPLNPGMFVDGLFVVESDATLEQLDDPDATQACVSGASGVSIGNK